MLIMMRHVMTNADGDEFYVRIVFDLVDRVFQVLFEIVARINQQRTVIDGQPVGDHH